MFRFYILIFSVIIFLPFSARAAVLDTDGDGLSDDLENKLTTDPENSDTDSDGFTDGEEVKNGYNPLKGDNDKSLSRRVEVDITKQQAYYFLNNVKVGTVPVSTGVRGMDTPKGEFKIMRKLPVHLYAGPGYYLPNTKWNLEFKRGYYLHGAYWHNQFGIRPMSHGCVNISTKNAEKIYAFLKVGDRVKVYGTTPTKKLVQAPWQLEVVVVSYVHDRRFHKKSPFY